MNSSGIIPPPEGVKSLRAAREAVAGRDISWLHIQGAIIKAHIALELLFRQYLSQVPFVPDEARRAAEDHRTTSFPDLVRAMSAYGKPSLSGWETAVLELNQVRIQQAHYSPETTTSRDAIALVELVEDIYQQYSQVDLENSTRNSAPHKPMNPFMEEPQKASALTEYTTDDDYHVVWLKGKKAKVPGKGTFRCPVWTFDRIASVCMHERKLPIDLSATQFFSSDKLPVQVQIDLIAKVKALDRALIAVATCFDENLQLLETDVTSLVREFCRSRSADSLLACEKELATELVTRLEAATSSSTFLVQDASTHFRIPFLEKAAEREADSAITFEQRAKSEEREANLTKLSNARTLAELLSEIERQKLKVEAECAARTAEAGTETAIEAASLANLQDRAKLTDDFKTAIFHLKPEIYERIRLAEITNDMQSLEKAIGLLRPFAEITKSAAPIVITHTN